MKFMVNHADEPTGIMLKNLPSVIKLLRYIDKHYSDIPSIRLVGDNEVGAWIGDVHNLANVLYNPTWSDDGMDDNINSYAFLYLFRRKEGWWALSATRKPGKFDSIRVRMNPAYKNRWASVLEIAVIGECSDADWDNDPEYYTIPDDDEYAEKHKAEDSSLTTNSELVNLITAVYNKRLLRTLSMLAGEFDIQHPEL